MATFIWLGGWVGGVPHSALGMVVGVSLWGVGVMCEGKAHEVFVLFVDGTVP